jgi:hypothetical protein
VADLRSKCDLVDVQIVDLERYIARNASKAKLSILRMELTELDEKRVAIIKGLQAQIAEQGCAVALGVKQTADDAPGDESDSDSEIEHQVQEDISLPQECMHTT